MSTLFSCCATFSRIARRSENGASEKLMTTRSRLSISSRFAGAPRLEDGFQGRAEGTRRPRHDGSCTHSGRATPVHAYRERREGREVTAETSITFYSEARWMVLAAH